VIALLAAHALAAIAAPFLVRGLGRKAFPLLAIAPAAAAVWAGAMTSRVQAGDLPVEQFHWVPALGMTLTFRLDTLSWLLTLIVGGVGALVLLYCTHYFDDSEPGLGAFAGNLTAFAGAMLGLILSDDLLVLYVFWELTTVLSYLLIGHYSSERASRSAATQALVVTTAGGLAMLAGIVLLGQHVGSYRLSAIVADPPSGAIVTVAVVLLLAGAITKSALVPFHFWLPGAMAAPTPVSAYLHAAAMVKAGVYLVARLAPGFADLPSWRVVVLVLGGLTMLVGAWRALRQYDLKLLLAFGTVSQLGFMTTLVGFGTRGAALAGLTVVLAHALFKACLFLVVGLIDHATGTRDLRELNGLRRSLPWAFWASVLAAASMAGVPPLLGFVGKEAAYGAFAGGQGVEKTELVVLLTGSVLTFAYSARFVWGAFVGRAASPTPIRHAPGVLLTLPPVLLALLSLVEGPLSGQIEPLLAPYVNGLPTGPNPVHLGLWHGVNTALLLSVLTIVLGSLIFLARTQIEQVQERLPVVGDADNAYRRTMRGLDRISMEVTGGLQRGSLPLTLGLILGVMVLLPGGALLLGVHWPEQVRWWDSPAQAGVGLVIAVAAVWTARSRRRLRAAILLGVTGYGTAMLFLLHGAPDLALTQILVETVTLVVFVLVLRRLPSRFWDIPPGIGRWVRAGLGALVAFAVMGMALTASAVRTAQPASVGFAEGALNFGGGRNIVNVTLVDIRAWDTMGELSVIVVAATGVASLIFLRERFVSRSAEAVRRARARRGEYASVGGAGGHAWLASDPAYTWHARSVMFEVITRLVFHTIIVFSLYLLFSGHNNPGGGFAAGLVAGLGLVVRYLAGGRSELRAAVPIMPGLLLGAGLFLSAGVGLVAMLAGGNVLQSWIIDLHLPLLGDLHLVTSLFFDVGVYLVVIGLMLDVLRSLGAQLDVQIESEQPEEPSGGEGEELGHQHVESGLAPRQEARR
jgi:multicomponent Na+:H+ antiporter subunit A